MAHETRSVRRKTTKFGLLPSHIVHRSFSRANALAQYDAAAVIETWTDDRSSHMPDDITRNHSAVMHYCAFRMHAAERRSEYNRWHDRYVAVRDRIVLGNRKLIYRAVRRRMGNDSRTDDLIGECHIVLIQAVQVYNPWIGIRFSTYAYTCLVRALSRLAQKSTHDRLAAALSFSGFQDFEPADDFRPTLHSDGGLRLEDYFRPDHPLLTDREKGILSRRYLSEVEDSKATLESVGAAMGLSKERVRQVQTLALAKLRKALTVPCEV